MQLRLVFRYRGRKRIHLYHGCTQLAVRTHCPYEDHLDTQRAKNLYHENHSLQSGSIAPVQISETLIHKKGETLSVPYPKLATPVEVTDIETRRRERISLVNTVCNCSYGPLHLWVLRRLRNTKNAACSQGLLPLWISQNLRNAREGTKFVCPLNTHKLQSGSTTSLEVSCSWLVSWCSEPSQPQRILSGLFIHSAGHYTPIFFSQTTIQIISPILEHKPRKTITHVLEPVYILRALSTGTCINCLYQ